MRAEARGVVEDGGGGEGGGVAVKGGGLGCNFNRYLLGYEQLQQFRRYSNS